MTTRASTSTGAVSAPAGATAAVAQRGLPPVALAQICAIAEAFFATKDGPPPPPRLEWLRAEIQDYLTHAGARARAMIRLAVWVVTWFLPLRHLRLPPFSRLSLPTRVRLLERCEGGLFSVPFVALKAILTLVYFEHPEMETWIGYDRTLGGRS